MGWSIRRSGDRVVAVFDGRLTTEQGKESAVDFVAAVVAAGTVDAVFDIRRMDGYDTGARSAWQKALWPHRHDLRSITLVGGNALVRMGGKLLGMALGVEVRTTDGSEDANSESTSP